MKKIIPFKKEMLFNNNVHEITSISLEHDLKEKENNLVSGNFYISGEYKVSDTSTNTETFNFTLPCDINLDNKYILKNLKIDIDDFYYEVINSNILKVNIDVLLDNLEEKEEIKEEIVEEETVEDIEEEKIKAKKIAYAASFGTDQWELTPEQTAIAAPLAQKFDLVTVREDSGVCLCKDYLNVNAFHVLDPTMLLAKENYIRLMEQEKEPKSTGNLFNYILLVGIVP